MNYYCQQQYSGNLGSSPYSIALKGCLTTCLGEVKEFAYPGSFSNPQQTEQLLDYTPGGLIIWSSLANIRLKLVGKVTTSSLNNYALVSTIQEGLQDPNTWAILEINNGAHFVLALGKALLGGYTISDPWTGRRTTTRDYHNNVTGCRIIGRV